MKEITYLDRESWGADPWLPRMGYTVPEWQFRGLVVHHTVMVLHDTDYDNIVGGDLDDIAAYMRRLQVARADLGLDVPYSWVVFEGTDPTDAVICEGRGRTRTGAHTAGYNSSRWGVALGGDYTDTEPTPGMLAGVRQIGRWLPDPHGAEPTLGHRDTVATACPGQMAYPHLAEIQPPYDNPQTKEDLMPDYIVRGPGTDDPWVAVYHDGFTRHVGGDEAGHILQAANPELVVVVEHDRNAFARTVRLAGSLWPANEPHA